MHKLVDLVTKPTVNGFPPYIISLPLGFLYINKNVFNQILIIVGAPYWSFSQRSPHVGKGDAEEIAQMMSLYPESRTAQTMAYDSGRWRSPASSPMKKYKDQDSHGHTIQSSSTDFPQ